MEFPSSIQGYISHSAIENSASNKVLWFTIWNIFFATVLSGFVLYHISLVLDPKNIPSKLTIAVPAQSSFFIAFAGKSGKKPLVKRNPDDELEVPSIPFHLDIPRILFFGRLGITHFLAPLILPFLLIYLCLAYVIYRNQFLDVYALRYEMGGKFWLIAHNSMIFSIVLMHAIAVGIFTLKLSLALILMIPQPILTLIFKSYCRKRFPSMFITHSAESLTKKDLENQNNPSMSEFYNAYPDPALMLLHYSSNPCEYHMSRYVLISARRMCT